MARITVEDCVKRINNRFQLVLVAARRARQIAKGSAALVPELNDKPTVVALREIAEDKVGVAILNEMPESAMQGDDAAAAGERPETPTL